MSCSYKWWILALIDYLHFGSGFPRPPLLLQVMDLLALSNLSQWSPKLRYWKWPSGFRGRCSSQENHSQQLFLLSVLRLAQANLTGQLVLQQFSRQAQAREIHLPSLNLIEHHLFLCHSGPTHFAQGMKWSYLKVDSQCCQWLKG